MSDRNSGREGRARMWRRLSSALVIIGGVVMCATGFALGMAREGDAATGWGVLAGVGMAAVVVGLVKLWIDQQVDIEANDPGGSTKRERLQAQRSRMLWIFPIVAVVFLFQATRGSIEILNGSDDFKHYINIALPVLYAWVVAMIVMGWDGHTRKNRKLMEDELTVLIRARAMTASAIVMMLGLTIAFGLGLWRTEMGVLAIPFVLTAGAATAGIRFAWLDREAGRDG